VRNATYFTSVRKVSSASVSDLGEWQASRQAWLDSHTENKQPSQGSCSLALGMEFQQDKEHQLCEAFVSTRAGGAQPGLSSCPDPGLLLENRPWRLERVCPWEEGMA
jgi:hypothetical protein